jgi:hypothetical protein
MSDPWNIAAVAVALMAMFVSTSPAALALFQQSTRWLLCLVCPSKGRCRRILWKNVPDGLLHQCNPFCQHVNTQTAELHGFTNCWDDTLGRVFNKTWYFIKANPTNIKYITKKPWQLPFLQEYIQTDLQTLKAFIMLTAKICHTCESADPATLLEAQRIGDIFTVHLRATGPVPFNTALTRDDIDRFIEGYPPFYRSCFTTTGGITINYPTIPGPSYMGWGAWILAVGMATTNGPICSIHNMKRVTHEKPEAYWKGTLVMDAFVAIGRTLSQLELFEDSRGPHPQSNPSKHSWAKDAVACFNMIMNEKYSSQPWVLKTQQIEQENLFKSVVGECPCSHKCIGTGAHSR